MEFTAYPDPPIAPLSVPQGGARIETGFRQRSGAPSTEYERIYAEMMFIRVVMIGGSTAPTFFIASGAGPSVAVGTIAQSVYRETVNGVGSGEVGEVWLEPGPGNVWLLAVGFGRAMSETWSLGIRNNDTTYPREFAWVVADNPGDTQQTWVDAATFAPEFAGPPDQPFAPTSGAPASAVLLRGKNFNVGIPKVFFGDKSAQFTRPPTATSLEVRIPDGLIPPGKSSIDVPIAVSTSAGNAVSSDTFQVSIPSPLFVGDPFAPKAATAGTIIVLSGKHFHFEPVTVTFTGLLDCLPGTIIGTPSSSQIAVQVPQLAFPGIFPQPVPATITVTTAGGSVTTPDRIVLPDETINPDVFVVTSY
ncbi:MAG: hypothetical protein EOP16_00515 [Pseudonocardia sp.]|nr:MAG: hypothetical protein EOP16_00515 [Pseudonocardia sp.]